MKIMVIMFHLVIIVKIIVQNFVMMQKMKNWISIQFRNSSGLIK